MRIDTDAVLETGPEDGDGLLVLLHGRGADEHDLLPLAEALALPDRVASLPGPVPWQGGRAWVEQTPSAAGDAFLDPAAQAVLEWLDGRPRVARRIRLLGFSQGGALALQLLRAAPDRFASAVVLAGFVPTVDDPRDEAVARVHPPVFYGHGAIDPVIPRDAVDRTRTWLAAHTAVEEREYPMLGHAISAAELADVATFLAR
ncbi:MAG: alpha/beta hydrolase [Amnibacterium sp.]